MKNPIKNLSEFVRDKRDSWKYKDNLTLAYENPILFELKWTGEHFRKDLYRLIREQGISKALRYDALVLQFRFYPDELEPLNRMETTPEILQTK